MMKFPVYQSSTERMTQRIEKRILHPGELEMQEFIKGRVGASNREKLAMMESYCALLDSRSRDLMNKRAWEAGGKKEWLDQWMHELCKYVPRVPQSSWVESYCALLDRRSKDLMNKNAWEELLDKSHQLCKYVSRVPRSS